jgi:hypothetical protein
MRHETKRLGAVGLCLAAVLVVGMALAGDAVAAPLWLVCLEGSGLTKYSNSKCTKAESSGKWQSEELASGKEDTVKLTLAATLMLRDTKTTLGEAEIQCYDATTGGVIEGTNKGKITFFEAEKPKESCKGIKVCKEKEVEEVKGEHLPWNLEIAETENTEKENTLFTKITNGGSGEPGWKVKCKTSLGSETDTCESENAEHAGRLELANDLSSELFVLGNITWPSSAKCSLGGKNSGQIEDLVSISAHSGALSIQPDPVTPPWFEVGPRPYPIKIPVAPRFIRVVIKNRSTTESLKVNLNNTLALPFVRFNTSCPLNTRIPPLEACEDAVQVEVGTAAGEQGHLRITMEKVVLGGEETKNIFLESE